MKRILALLIVFIIPLSNAMPVHEWNRHVYYRSIIMHAPAVAKGENGYFGVLTEINVTMMNGSGNVFVITSPMTELDMQGSAKLAVDVAGMITGEDVSKYNFFFQVKSDSPIVGGPSAGATMTVAVICLLKNLDARSDVIMTGMINPDGSIGPVGGILEKGEAAGKAGMHYFLVPKGQSVEYKTVEKKIGPFIISEPELVNVSKILYENYSLIVREVEDINDALAYFTNYTFEEETSEQQIITAKYYRKILKPLVGEALEEANESYEKADQLFEKSNIPVGYPYNPWGRVLNALDDAEQALKDAKLAYENAFYYSSISKVFQANIKTRFALYVCQYYNGTSIDEIRKNVSDAVSDALKTAGESQINGFASLQCVGAAQQRALDAKEYINISTWNVLDYLDYLAYAMERSKTVYWWLNLSQKFNESHMINESWIRSMAQKYYDYANDITLYAKILSQETGYSGQFVKQADNLLQKAYEQKDKYPASSLFNSLEAIANANLAIEMIGIGEDAVYDKLNRTQQMASFAIEKARNMSIEPILAVSYAEFGRSYEKQNVATALTYYKYAYMIANMLCLATGYIPKELKKSQTTVNERAENNNSYFKYITIGCITFVAGIAVGASIRRKRKDKKEVKTPDEAAEGLQYIFEVKEDL
ncbi:MAG: hypothetical protein FE047_02730 [Thermoplasmata archaeon]|nr:MAG: hypothetical protein FE047_02730 [Thermoplasmata archaeon]KAA0010145.1 MAG: hypothetical protein FE041_05330 [Thermoplasmata archaeon]OYT59793.1 MAG: hypothetical protein B6U81_05565 [Thermoplasmatales archaeon ex4484_30]